MAKVCAMKMVIACQNPKCEQRLRVPDDRPGILKVQCPTCGESFRWSAPGSKLEIRELTVYCAKTGLKSNVVFARDRPTDLFRLRRVDANNESVVARAEAWNAAQAMKPAPKPKQAHTSEVGRRLLQLARDWMGRGAVLKPDPAHSVTGLVEREEEPPKGTAENGRLLVSEFDFSGFYCPHCRFEREGFDVLHCSHCDEITCAGTVIEVPNGNFSCRCYPACGGGGLLSPPRDFDFKSKGVEVAPTNDGPVLLEKPRLRLEKVTGLLPPRKRLPGK
jgi:hypothetical protein